MTDPSTIRALLTTRGRMSLGRYWVLILIPACLVQLFAWLTDVGLGLEWSGWLQDAIRAAFGEAGLYGSPFAGPVSAAIAPLLYWVAAAATVRRLHDLDITGWAYAALAVAGIVGFSLWVAFPDSGTAKLPYILAAMLGLPIGFMALFTSGSEGVNRYGPDPREPSAVPERPPPPEEVRGIERGGGPSVQRLAVSTPLPAARGSAQRLDRRPATPP